ncbi:acrosin-like [Adelges cooleyi]|uniref:acrosin-like n=1 Tax=Adelges cooleyi TaxID=133065 RepID=UPI00217FF7A3|nr:acrosin-like [Adelges cooleyi]
MDFKTIILTRTALLCIIIIAHAAEPTGADSGISGSRPEPYLQPVPLQALPPGAVIPTPLPPTPPPPPPPPQQPRPNN